MRPLLSVNTGSSSVRLALHQAVTDRPITLASALLARGDAVPAERMRAFVAAHAGGPLGGVAHRVVHGGRSFTGPRRIDECVEAEIERLAPLAPLHNPEALHWLRAAREAFGAGLPQVAVFDTAFHATLPEAAARYALPHALAEQHGLRRYGFHGLAHRALWARWCALRPDLPAGGRLVSLQLGAGCSACAIDQGRSVDTTMGYSPLEGLMMATRSGDVDAAVLLALQRDAGLEPAALERMLTRESGLLGVSGLSSDMRVLLASEEPRAQLAVAMFCHRVRKAIGACLAVLGGADGIVFGGGIGENAVPVRARILEGFEWAALRLDPQANAACIGREGRISRADGGLQAWVVPVDEAHEIATQALPLLAAPSESTR